MKKTTKTAATKSCAKKKTACSEKKPAVSAPAVKKVVGKAAEKASVPAVKKSAKKTAASAKESAQKVTRIIAHVDVGWGNMLYIRGEGAGLSWEQGVPMICSNGTEWHWIAATEAGPISFKFLVNDETWAVGENVTINAGDVYISDPIF